FQMFLACLFLPEVASAQSVPQSLISSIEKFYECAIATDKKLWEVENEFVPVRVCGARIKLKRNIFLTLHSCIISPETLDVHKANRTAVDDYVEYFLEFHCRNHFLSMIVHEYADKVTIESIGQMTP
ncbi:MAG TPA: hypothetical protein VIF60_20935, partial [Burkholderiaceae bacterium]